MDLWLLSWKLGNDSESRFCRSGTISNKSWQPISLTSSWPVIGAGLGKSNKLVLADFSWLWIFMEFFFNTFCHDKFSSEIRSRLSLSFVWAFWIFSNFFNFFHGFKESKNQITCCSAFLSKFFWFCKTLTAFLAPSHTADSMCKRCLSSSTRISMGNRTSSLFA